MSKLMLVLAALAILLPARSWSEPTSESGLESGLGLVVALTHSDDANNLRVSLAGLGPDGLTSLDAQRLSAVPGLPPGWASDPAVTGLPGTDFLSRSLVEAHLLGNTGLTFVPYAGAWAEPLAWDDMGLWLTPGDQAGARYAWNFGGGAIWFFRDVLGVDLGVRWTEKKYRLSREGLRINDVTTFATLNPLGGSAYIGVRMPLR